MNDIKEAVVSDFHLFANNIKLFDRLIAIEDCSFLQRSLDTSQLVNCEQDATPFLQVHGHLFFSQ